MYDPFNTLRNQTPSTGPRDSVHPGWPEVTPTVILNDGLPLRLRPLTYADGHAWVEMRLCDEAHLRPVEPTPTDPWEVLHSANGWRNTFSNLRNLAKEGTVVPLVIELQGRFVGQVTIGGIVHGATSEAWIGYWVYSQVTGRGVATAACALGTDHVFTRIGLHRLTATYMPENPASGRVLELSGFREEGFMRRNLHINGRWTDHHFVAKLRDESPFGAVEGLLQQGRISAFR